MPLGLKRGFLSKHASCSESPAVAPSQLEDKSVEGKTDSALAHSDIGFQFSDVCRVYSQDPCIIVTDCRLPTAPHLLFLPAKNAEIVFVDSLHSVQSIAKWPLWGEPRPAALLNPPFVIRDCGEKGVGMFAWRPIARGELIMLERPVYVSHPTIQVYPDQRTSLYEAALAGLSPATQAVITALRNAHPVSADISRIRGLLLTNALATVVPHATVRFPALYPNLCRANHACTPNAHYFFCTATFTGRLYALRAVAAGEEITIGYTELAATRAQRRADLDARYAFSCACATCGLPEEAAATSDARRACIAAYITQMKTGERFPPGAVRERVEELVRSAEAEGLVECASVLLISALRLAQRDQDPAAELRLTVDAMNYVRALEGNDSAGFTTLASRLGLSAPQLAAIFDSTAPGSLDYMLFAQLLVRKQS